MNPPANADRFPDERPPVKRYAQLTFVVLDHAPLLAIIRCADDDTLAAVLRYSPVWGGAIYRVWQPGYHTQPLWSEYRLSNALYALAHSPDEWRWLSGA